MTYRRLRDYQEWELAAGQSENTRIDRFELLQRAEHEIGELTRATESRITKWLANPAWSTATRATYWGHLHSYLIWALKGGLIDKDPMINLPRPKVPKRSPRPASLDAYQAIMTAGEIRERAQAAGILGKTRYWTPEIHCGAFNLPPYIAEHLPRAAG